MIQGEGSAPCQTNTERLERAQAKTKGKTMDPLFRSIGMKCPCEGIGQNEGVKGGTPKSSHEEILGFGGSGGAVGTVNEEDAA